MSNRLNKEMRQKAKKLNTTYHPKTEGRSAFMEYDHPNAFGRVVAMDTDTVTDIKNRMEYIPTEFTRWVNQCGSYEKRHRDDKRFY